MTPPVRVAIVDDDALVRAGLIMMLDGVEGISIVGEAADGDQVMGLVDAHAPDVILMDIRMPKVDGISATARVRRRSSRPEVLVLTTFDTDDHVVRALRAGANGFLLKDTPPAKIVAAIHAVANGEPAMSPQVMRRLMAVAGGLSNAEIAAALFMSVATVKAHVSSILSKLDLDNRTQIALLAYDAGLD